MPTPQDEAKVFGQDVRSIRKQLKLTQSEFAQEIGVEQATVSRWESGSSTPTIDKFRAVIFYAEGRGIKIADLSIYRDLTQEQLDKSVDFIAKNIPVIGVVGLDSKMDYDREGETYRVVIPPANATKITKAFDSFYPRGLYNVDKSCLCYFEDKKTRPNTNKHEDLSLIKIEGGATCMGHLLPYEAKHKHNVMLCSGVILRSVAIEWIEKITLIMI